MWLALLPPSFWDSEWTEKFQKFFIVRWAVIDGLFSNKIVLLIRNIIVLISLVFVVISTMSVPLRMKYQTDQVLGVQPFKSFLYYTQLFQSWTMFTPKPKVVKSWQQLVMYRNGEKTDVFTGKAPTLSFPDDVQDLYSSFQHWIYTSRLALTYRSNNKMTQDYLKYYCREYILSDSIELIHVDDRSDIGQENMPLLVASITCGKE